MLRAYSLSTDRNKILIQNPNGRHVTAGDFFRVDTYTMVAPADRALMNNFKIDDGLITRFKLLMALPMYAGCSLELTPHGGWRGAYTINGRLIDLNRLVRGASGSTHKNGRGGDYRLRNSMGQVMDIPTMVVMMEHVMWKNKLPGGNGIYDFKYDYAHADSRGNFAEWFGSYDGSNCQAQGGYPTTLQLGEDAAGIALIQRALTAAGYPCGVDGRFGSSTDAALKKYQAKKGLLADGVYGKNTNAVLKALPW